MKPGQLLALLTVILVFTSCSKKSENVPVNINNDQKVFEIITTERFWAGGGGTNCGGSGTVFKIGVDISQYIALNCSYITVEESYDNKATWTSIPEQDFCIAFMGTRQKNVYKVETYSPTSQFAYDYNITGNMQNIFVRVRGYKRI